MDIYLYCTHSSQSQWPKTAKNQNPLPTFTQVGGVVGANARLYLDRKMFLFRLYILHSRPTKLHIHRLALRRQPLCNDRAFGARSLCDSRAFGALCMRSAAAADVVAATAATVTSYRQYDVAVAMTALRRHSTVILILVYMLTTYIC